MEAPSPHVPPQGKQTLHQLDAANLFVVPLDDERTWYRFHHLFADLLRARLRETEPDGISELHRRAAGWYEANGLPAEAVHHTLATEDGASLKAAGFTAVATTEARAAGWNRSGRAREVKAPTCAKVRWERPL